MKDTLEQLTIASTSITGIEMVHQIPADEPVKITMQVLLGIINLIWIFKQHRQTRIIKRKTKRNGE